MQLTYCRVNEYPIFGNKNDFSEQKKQAEERMIICTDDDKRANLLFFEFAYKQIRNLFAAKTGIWYLAVNSKSFRPSIMKSNWGYSMQKLRCQSRTWAERRTNSVFEELFLETFEYN